MERVSMTTRWSAGHRRWLGLLASAVSFAGVALVPAKASAAGLSQSTCQLAGPYKPVI
jgi:hypothetical protein